jgi:DUF4097 and DUF4098 domain-containing protein YvlB
MKRLLGFAMAFALLAVPASAQTMKREFNASPGETLELDLEAGGSVRVEGWSQNRVEISVEIGGRDGDNIEVSMSRTSNGVRIGTDYRERRRSSSSDVDIEVKVPDRFDISVDSAGGNVIALDLEGEISGKTAGGNVDLRGIRGRLDLKTMGGNVDLAETEADGSVTTMGGNLTLKEVAGDLKVKTMGGNINLSDVAGEVSADTMGGNVRLRAGSGYAHGRPVGPLDLSTMGGNITVDAAEEFVKAKTMGGNIEIESLDGGLLATTMGGNVTVKVSPDGSYQDGDIEISSKGGDIKLSVPDGFSMDLDIELAYTKNSRGDYGIESDFPLNITRTDQWTREGDGHGSPRKFIRGKGAFGGGAHKVTISTINGDVFLKRH